MDARREDPTVVIGGGLSSSLLVQELAAAGRPGPVLLLDRRPAPLHDRAWATFVRGTTGLPVRSTYRRVQVAGVLGVHAHDLAEHSYVVIDGDRLAAEVDAALRILGGARSVSTAADLRLAPRAGVQVVTDSGVLVAPRVYDAVGLPVHDTFGSLVAVPPQQPAAWLRFAGRIVRASSPAFEPDTVTLMDFRVPQEHGLAFGYVLPSSAHEALVELTTFTASADDQDGDAVGDERGLDRYLDLVAPTGWVATPSEAGRLPLVTRPGPRRHGSRVVRIGTAAGCLKASSGYGVPFMVRDAVRLAHDPDRPGRPHPPHRRWMDEVFLRFALTEPATLATALETMFARNPIDRIARFLDEETSVAEDAALVASLPAGPFLRHLRDRRGRG